MSIWWIIMLFFGLFLGCPMSSQVMEPASEAPTPVEPVTESVPPVNANELAIEGVVVDHIQDCVVDGYCYVVVETAEGSQYNVIYSPGDIECPYPTVDPNIWDLAVGDQVEAFGELIEGSDILLCNSEAYYLNMVNHAANELAIEGVVIEHIHDCIFDGICGVVVETAEGNQYTVVYSPGMTMCPNPNLDPNLSELVAGDQVEAFGEVLEDGSILLCNSDTYYLNKIAN